MKFKFLLILLLIAHCSLLIAQNRPPSTQSKKAERMFMDALDFYNGKAYNMALKALGKAIDEDGNFIDAFILQGDIYSEQGKIADALDAYKKAIGINPGFSPRLYYICGNLELASGKYQDARTDFGKFLDSPGLVPEQKAKVANAIRTCDFGINAMAHPVPFDPVNLGDSINTTEDEYINAITADEQKLYFTRKVPKNKETVDQANEFEEDFYFSKKIDSAWRHALNLGAPINTHGNEGAICIAPDGQHIFFAACNRDDGLGSCDLYWSKKNGNEWSVPENMGAPVNSPAWDSQPAFSSDGKTLYFASKREGGKGSSDLWKTELQTDGSWTIPVNLGDSINTRSEEMAPFIHPDDQTLYFSSKGHPGMGGLDLFYARKDVNGNWRKPVNMGYPINTFSDEITLVVNANGDLAYVSSDKLGGKGKQDIYAFKLYKEAQPLKATYFKGIVFDKVTKERLQADFELIDLETGKMVITSSSDGQTGEFLLSLPANKNYGLNVSRKGYLFYSDHFELRGETSKTKPFLKDIPLQRIRVGETVVLKNIFFDTDKFDLKDESRSELDKLIALLKANPSIRIEISGHTDIMGKADHNLILSKNRAKAVYDFLASNGIPATRLTYEGYGQTRPVDTNDTEQGRANNRRTEFRVIAE